MSDRIVLPVLNQNYDCHSCGHCCRNYTVPVTDEERARIEGQGWSGHPDFAGEPLFVRHAASEDYVLNQKPDGSCVFLSDGGRCRIHEEFGGHTKPLGCRMYPYVFNRVGTAIYVSVRYDCPSVAGNKGRALDTQKNAIAALGREAVASRAERPLTFRGMQSLPDDHLVAAAQSLEWIVADHSLDFTRRISACVNLAHLLRACNLNKVDELGKMREFLHLASDVVVAEAKATPLERKPPRKLAAMFFRLTLAMYGRRDREALGFGQRWQQVRATLSGRSQVPPWQPQLPAIPFVALEESFGVPNEAASELLGRSLRSKLGGMGFFGPVFHGFSFLEGLFSLLLAVPVTLWYARLFAAASNHREIDEDAATKALHIVEGPWGRRRVFRLRAERWRTEVLTRQENLRTLVVWYGS